MRKYLIILIVSLTFITGCTIKKVETDSIKNIFDTVLYREKKLSNTYMDGYKIEDISLDLTNKEDFINIRTEYEEKYILKNNKIYYLKVINFIFLKVLQS